MEGVPKGGELGLHHRLGIAGDLERLLHDIRAMVPDGAAGQLHAVAHHVILEGKDIQRVHGLQRLLAALRHGEGVVREFDLAGLLVHFEHREIDDPAQPEHVLFQQVEILAQLGAGLTGELGGLQRLVAGEEHRVAIAEAGALLQVGQLFRRQELGDRAAPLAFREHDVAHARRAHALRPAVHAVTDRAAAAVRPRNGAHDGALLDVLAEHGEIGVGENTGDVADDQRVAQVRLVAAIFQQRLGEGDARELVRHAPVGEFAEHARQHRFDSGEHILLLDEAHLQIELVELARAAVGAAVLVAETGGDLEIAVEAGDHHQLLELLRRLRQGVELARMQAAGHQEVARALR